MGNKNNYTESMPEDNSIEALLFDLGGVIIDIDFDYVFLKWAEYSGEGFLQIKNKFTFDEFYEAHERGEIAGEEYFSFLRKKLGIDISNIQFENGWNSIFNGEVAGIYDLLKPLKGRLPLYGFTNSNHTHKKIWSRKYSKVIGLFEQVFNSSDIGKRKPEPEAFQFIADSIGIELKKIVFYDDSDENIIGAKKVGLKTVHVQSISDIERSIKDIFE